MKLLSISILIAASILLAGCNSLDNPFANLFKTGKDARVYNPQTGQFEGPAENATPRPQKSAAIASALSATPAPQHESDGRYFDPQKNEWVEIQKPRPASSSSSKPTSTPMPVTKGAPGPMVAMAPAPAPSGPARASGTYNSTTGKIEWNSAGEYIPPATPAPKSDKHWWWPF